VVGEVNEFLAFKQALPVALDFLAVKLFRNFVDAASPAADEVADVRPRPTRRR
jgi:hypothetical protein